MDPERQREISAEGGRASHGGGRLRMDDDDEDMNEERSSRSNSRGGSREQHAETGRQSGESRRARADSH